MAEKLAELQALLDAVNGGGGPKYVERHRERGKLLPRERIELLLDRDSAFLELQPFMAQHTDFHVGASMVAGIGVVEGAPNADAARRLAAFLLSEGAQRDVRERLFEYPLIEGGGTPEGSRPLGSLQGPDIDLRDLGEQLESTLELLNEVGFTV